MMFINGYRQQRMFNNTPALETNSLVVDNKLLTHCPVNRGGCPGQFWNIQWIQTQQ